MESISAVGVILATLSSFIVGSIWYMPATFMPAWMKLTGTTDEQLKARFPMGMAAIGVASLVTAYILAHFMVYTSYATGTTGVANGLETALWAWLGISATTVVSATVLEPRKPMYMVITAGNRLATLLVMGLILGLFMK